jgi:hypothetical protein
MVKRITDEEREALREAGRVPLQVRLGRACRGPGQPPQVYCERGAKLDGLCDAHYQQRYRGKEKLTPLKVDTGADAQITFRCQKELKAEVKAAAEEDGVEPGEWCREALRLRLQARKPAKP